VFAVFWLIPARFRVPFLLLASYVFYMAWRPIYLLLIVGLTLANFWFGNRIWLSQHRKKAWLIAAIVTNVGALTYFKYFYFLEDVLDFLLKPWFGHFEKLPVNIILPLGISFFVFEFIHYIVDVYKGSEPVKNFWEFALFPSFFPTQIAGPIKRYQDFVPQLKTTGRLTSSEFDEGAFLILSGLFKKVLLADNLALFVAGGFSNPQLFSNADMWLFAMAFDFQVYFDFGGYADIARGSAKLLGYKVPINFDFPYLSSSISEFWRRWHITLGSWLRDYLYIPMGGSRKGRAIAARNLIITMMIGGLWHGAEFHYVLWGLYQGVLLAAHREFKIFKESSVRLSALFESRGGYLFSVVLTFLAATIGMAIFRASNSASALLIVRKMLFIDGFANQATAWSSLISINYPLIFPSIFVLLPTILVGQVLLYWMRERVPSKQYPRVLRAAYGATLIFLITAFASDTSPRFIYFQF
jgi:alginate O-acetyltransferase complex protein AlgI